MDEDREFRIAMMSFIAHDFKTTNDNICLIQAVEEADFYGCEELKSEIIEVLKEKLKPEGKKLQSHRRRTTWPSLFECEIRSNGGNASAAYKKIADQESVTKDAVRKFLKRNKKK